jgi:hypothetical protein
VRDLNEDAADAVRDRAYSLTLLGVLVAAGGSLLALSVQAANAGNGYGPSGMLDVAFDTRWGTWWLARVVLLVMLAGALSLSSLWDDPPKTSDVLIALGIGGLALLPFSLASHAAANRRAAGHRDRRLHLSGGRLVGWRVADAGRVGLRHARRSRRETPGGPGRAVTRFTTWQSWPSSSGRHRRYNAGCKST